MYHIQYSPAAKRDLGRLKTYLNSEFGKEAAKRVLTDMTQSIRQLEEQPLCVLSCGGRGSKSSNHKDLLYFLFAAFVNIGIAEF